MVNNDGREAIVFPPDGPLNVGMAHAADEDLGLPLALVVKALGQAFGSLDSDSPDYLGTHLAGMRFEFENQLADVVARFMDGRLTY